VKQRQTRNVQNCPLSPIAGKDSGIVSHGRGVAGLALSTGLMGVVAPLVPGECYTPCSTREGSDVSGCWQLPGKIARPRCPRTCSIATACNRRWTSPGYSAWDTVPSPLKCTHAASINKAPLPPRQQHTKHCSFPSPQTQKTYISIETALPQQHYLG
jgi:hypothetical protein